MWWLRRATCMGVEVVVVELVVGVVGVTGGGGENDRENGHTQKHALDDPPQVAGVGCQHWLSTLDGVLRCA